MAGYSMQDQSMSFMDSDMPNMIGGSKDIRFLVVVAELIGGLGPEVKICSAGSLRSRTVPV